MALTLYHVSGSPFSWRVMLALEHKQVPYEAKLMSFSQGDLRTPEYLAINPRSQVPAITDDDFSLYESNAILRYLDERFSDGPSLFPGDARQRALGQRLVDEVDNYVGTQHRRLAGELFFKGDPAQRDQGVIADAVTKVKAELQHFESQLTADYFVGSLSAADYALYPFAAALPRFELRDASLGLTAAMGPELKAWMGRIEALPYFDKTFPPHWR